MKMFIYSVFDSCSAIYDRPFVGNADGAVIRSFGDIASDADHPIGKHPEHFALFRIGSFNDGTGEVEAELPVCIAKAHELSAAVRNVKQLDLFNAIRATANSNGQPPLSNEEILDVIGDKIGDL